MICRVTQQEPEKWSLERVQVGPSVPGPRTPKCLGWTQDPKVFKWDLGAGSR